MSVDYWAGRLDERLVWGWQRFADELRTRTRFVFWRAPSTSVAGSAEYEPADMLDALEQVIRRAGLILPFPARQRCYRGRKHDPEKVLSTAKKLGPPPAQNAVSMRMSPPGIAMFYGATDEATALAELRGIEGEVATVGEWVTAKESHIIDFCRLSQVPSIFCDEDAERRPYLRFVRRFVQEITRPVLAHDKPAIDYVPTQVVAEFIRHCIKTETGEPIEGVRYPSAMHQSGANIAFFVTASNLAGPEPLLKLIGSKRYSATGMKTTWQESDAPAEPPDESLPS